MEIGWVSFAANTPPRRKHRKERSKLVLSRLAGEKNGGASIEGHHMRCDKLLDRILE